MTANPLKPGRYRPGKPIAEDPSSSEEEEEGEEEDGAAKKAKEEEERRKRIEAQRQQPKATSFPTGAAGKITRGVKDVKIDEREDEDEDEEGFVTDEDEEEQGEEKGAAKTAPRVTGAAPESVPESVPATGEDKEEEEEEEEEEESSEEEEEESSEDEAPQRVLLRPTFIKKDKRAQEPYNQDQSTATTTAPAADTTATAEAHKAQRQEKADTLVRQQLEKDALERSAASKQWDDDEAEVAEEAAINDTDNLDPEAEYAAWKLRELKRVKRSRELIEASEKEREEVERRRNLTTEEREREDSEFLSKQKEEKEATRGQTGFMQRYFHKGAFFRPELESEGLDRRNIMGRRFVDDVSRETLPQYMQVRDLTQVGKKGRTRYRDLRSEDTGRFGEGFDRRSGRRDGQPPIGVTDERFLPDRERERKGPTGANASAVRERRRSRSRSRSRRRDRDHDRGDRYRPDGGSRRKRSPSPYDDRDKRRRMESAA